MKLDRYHRPDHPGTSIPSYDISLGTTKMSQTADFRQDTDLAWKEHGWGLRGWQVAVLVAVIAAVSVVMQLIG